MYSLKEESYQISSWNPHETGSLKDFGKMSPQQEGDDEQW